MLCFRRYGRVEREPCFWPDIPERSGSRVGLSSFIGVDLVERRERDESFPIRGRAPPILNRPLADVLVIFIQEITFGWE